MANNNNLIPFQFKKGQSGNPGGRPSSREALAHAMRETSDGKEIVERLIDLMRHGKREQTRLKAACELRDWLFGSPSPDRAVALSGGALTGVQGEIVRFAASFGPPLRAPGVEAKDDTVVEAAVVEAEARRIDTDVADSAETPTESSDSPEIA